MVTGHDSAKVARVLWDGPAANAKHPDPKLTSTLIWCTDEMPADISVGESIEDMGSRQLGTPPPENGTRFTVLDIQPGNSARMHRTETVDYAIVISGELEMQMDNSSVSLKAGDIVVQRGTNHAWSNRGTKPARLAVILIDAKPLGIGKAVSRAGNVPTKGT